MAKLLYITANVKDVGDSCSLTVGEKFLQAYSQAHPDDTIEKVDLFKEYIPLLDGVLIGHMFGQIPTDKLDDAHKKQVDRMSKNLEQFISADKYVFVTPLWNYGSPPCVKAYFDNLSVAGKTFQYTENGPVGLLKNKKALCIQASGGIYSSGDAAVFEHGVSYIKSVLALMGVTDMQAIYIEGVNIQTLDANEIIAAATDNAREMAQNF